MKIVWNSLIIGFALFAMFFGAGNLIFPPQLGFLTGSEWFITFIAFAITGIGVPILGIFAMAKANGDIRVFAGKVHPVFADVFGTIIMLGIGPLLALPRTAATTYEIGVLPFFQDMSPVLHSMIFFTIVLIFSLKQSRVVDRIGKYLTPFLIIVLAAIIIKGIVYPVGTVLPSAAQNFFLKGFLEGYQTMDALAAMLFATIIIKNIRERGYSQKPELLKMSIFAGLVAALGLLFVYGGLMSVGASAGTALSRNLSRAELLIQLCSRIWGITGKVILSLSIALACFTTAIGLTATAGHYFEKLLHGKISYHVIVIIVSIFSCWLANYGVESIIRYSVPLLQILYPVCILLVVMNIFDACIPNRYYYIGGVAGTMVVSTMEALITMEDLINSGLSAFTEMQISFVRLAYFLQTLPFAQFGIGWLIPALITAVPVGLIAGRVCSKK